MCRLNPIVWYALLLVVAYAAENQSNSTHEDKQQDDTMRYEPHVNFTTTWNHNENSMKDDDEASMQHEFYSNYTTDLHKKGSQNDTMHYEPHVNLTTTWDHDENSTRDDDEDSVQHEFYNNYTKNLPEKGNLNGTMHYEPHVNFTTTLDHDENSTRNDEDSVQHEFYSNYTKNLDEKSSQNVPAELRDNSTETNDGGNSTTLQLRPGSNSNQTNSKICNDTVCIPICCELGYRMIRDICMPDDSDYDFPEVHEISKKVDEVFPLFVSDPCIDGRYALDASLYPTDEYIILTNGSVYQTQMNKFIDPATYCFAVMNKSKYELTMCFDATSTTVDGVDFSGIPIGLLVSLPFLLLTFVVYTILPELWNMHGYTLRGYVGSLFVAYISLVPFQLISPDGLSDAVCSGSAFVIYFSFQASFFWLNVMCFDIWWTFGGFRSLQGSVKQREKKKFIMYSIYAWGCASILTILCLIMDFTPGIPETLIRPEFGYLRCWFTTDNAKGLYFYLPMSITVICNIFLFISTALKIIRHKKDTAHQLRSSESRRHDDNKQWFNLYLKLFIVMGINWSMEIISWAFKSAPAAVWYITDLTNALQGLIIFIIFVWKDKIRKLLLKRFGCREDIFSRNSTRSGCHSTSASRTITTGVSLQEKINPYVQNSNCRAKNSSDENSTDCPNV
ncbi:G-protein coupled receptor Mth2-like isoform X1 [Odontomachus brunneus]|uniref:G-protein coupled receptor Mth2-like isoform X1 n=1 Tax=Odontomachus brunneus TaxID=486640 RepID=UPI0013F18522|nr:G-protein coupled receptor Mth2-like isoform X1 [Odontomachus brunneus]XP_032664889.1 G-protein coupled receptor Mth2-like isoform X1 [Odontomachus brunneus]XP_032664890.1 G-protein coupled receptor Mth2-like isoform X1 [Odontomachus brunneus]XP_032664891.1 G-protein coupled receptor Mth2-like isoform X1 [Odontomachus brunneus]XP_032664893.1 G-protein coupled receptor Mth2-like isoform X1 [Odontomachus brunneus]